jgi:short-subunit dehydrogenase
MSYALIVGATSPTSLGRQLISKIKSSGSTPIVVGRSAAQVAHESELQGCLMISADLADISVATTILSAINDLSEVRQIIIAGGGPHYKGCLADEPTRTTQSIWDSIVLGPARLIQAFHAATEQPYHLVTVASTSAVRIRTDETTYATAQAARAVFAKNFHAELTKRKGSQSSIFYPGGMKTALWKDSANTEGFMDPSIVADIMWEHINRKDDEETLHEVVIDRAKDGSGTPVVILR